MAVSRRRFLATAGAAGAVFGVPEIVIAAPARDKFTVAVGAEHALVYLAWDVAKALGYFEREGLDVNLIYTKGGTEAGLALMSGNVDYSGNAIDHAIAAADQGKSLVMISDFMDQPGISLLCKAENRSKFTNGGASFRGKTIGITSVGSATDVLAHWIAHRAGVPNGDVKTVGVGGGSTVMAAIQSGQVDAAFANDPYATLLMKQGRAVSVADMYTSAVTRQWLGFNNYCFTGALTRADVIQKNPERTQKVVNALVRALKFMQKSTPEQLAQALPDEFRGGASVADWAASYAHSRPAYTAVGRISVDAVDNVIASNANFLGKTLSAKAGQLFDNSFTDRAARTVKV